MAGKISGITIEIAGDTTKLGRALKDTNSDLKSTQKEIKDIERSLKFQPGNIELTGQKFRALNDNVESTKNKLETLKEADKQAKQQLEAGELGQGEYEALRREIIKTEDQLKSLEDKAKETSEKLKNAGWEEAGNKFKKAGDNAQKFGKGLSTSITAPIIALGTASAAVWGDIDDALDGIVTATGASGEELDRLQDSFKNVYGSLPIEAEKASAAIGEVNTQFGLMDEELENASASVLKFAEINGADVVQSVQGAKGAIEAFGLSANDLDLVLDSVAKAAQDTGVSTDKIFDTITKNGGALKTLNLSFEESVALVGQLEQSGLDANKALGYMSKAAATLAKENISLTDGMAEFEELMASGASETEKLTAASELFGSKGALFMIDAAERGAISFKELAEMADGAAGTVASTFDDTLDPVDRITVALNNLKLIGADIWDTVQEVAAPILETLVEKAQVLSDKFREMDPQQKELIVTIGMIAAAAGPLIVIFGKIASGIGGLLQTIPNLISSFTGIAGAIGVSGGALFGIVGIITTVIGAIIHLWNTNEDFRNKVTEIWNGIKTTISNIWNGISKTLTSIWNGLKNTATSVWNAIKTVITTPINAVKDLISNVWNGISSTLTNIWNGLKNTASSVWSGIKTVIMTPINALKSFITNVWSGIKTTTTNVWNGIKNAITNPLQAAQNVIRGIIDRIKGFFNFQITWPKIPMPHFGISPPGWKIGDLLKGSIPRLSIQWYDKGGIFTSPQIIGVAEKRPEFVGALDDLKQIFTDSLNDFASKSPGGTLKPAPAVLITGNHFTVRNDNDIEKIAEALARKVTERQRGF